MMTGTFTVENKGLIDDFILVILKDFKNGQINEKQFIYGVTHAMTLIENGFHSEAIKWLREARRLIREDKME
ncbi:hypothetical protein HCK70_002166 [Salmonella enterica]|nr:hypothetical protein [Salmonella enterica]